MAAVFKKNRGATSGESAAPFDLVSTRNVID
jgi:hypothetical protein